MLTTARKAMLVCGSVALLGGGLAGMGLANYAQSGAFEFYKNTPPRGAPSLVATSDSAGYYPISRAAPTPAYPENPYPPRLTIARAAVPADYHRVMAEPEAPPPVVEEEAALPEPMPVVAPHRGSWTAPEEADATPEEEAAPGDTTS